MRPISVNDPVYYYNCGVFCGRVTAVQDATCDVLLDDGRQLRLPVGQVYPYRQLDVDVHLMAWTQLQDEVMKARGLFRWILSQQGDDICWRDFYVAAAQCLPGDEGQQALLNLATLPPPPIMLHNCYRFVHALHDGRPDEYTADEPATIVAELQARVAELEQSLKSADLYGRLAT